jgi:hypothetical protein
VTPTNTHFELARSFLAAGKHVLVEKPMTNNAAQAAELVQLAQEKKAILPNRPRRAFQSRLRLPGKSRHRSALHRGPSPLALPRS